ncbi:thiamine pyrophosphate-binding protein [Leekyejoonella antrihumi]|uniref:Thiamine pyrophosphate-binding protein n=1 Tax=Leekyejoonella antrihumi TaxID=1660198 RepID=A0A563DRU8_9MICO|nr:thiamine pyrophosphate-binding protein [Leekyejoonella antrihumi]TWP32970.1 thiamine pyrophosphate-binding protein [Leekyejoonella antrihumi]
MQVYEKVAETLWGLGVRQIFGVAGSGNYHVTRALIRHGAEYVSARHEGGAVSMADAFSRMSDSLPVVSVHQGGGLTNIITGLAEAAKSGTALIVLAGESPLADRRSNFRISQDRLVESVGAVSYRISQATATSDVREAVREATVRRIPVLLNFPVDVQVMDSPEQRPVAPLPAVQSTTPDPEAVSAVAELLLDARAPLIIGGRGARHARAELLDLAHRAGALTATSAVARGLFYGDPYNLDVMGDLATPIASELVLDSDVIVAFGCGLGNWTTSNGSLLPAHAKLVQIDDNPLRLGLQRPIDLSVVGDAAKTAKAIAGHIPQMEELSGKRRTRTNQKRIAEGGRWQDVKYRDTGTEDWIDPRTATIALDCVLDEDRNIAVDSGNFLGYPSMFLTVKDTKTLCFSQGFQCVGLGLASAIGHAIAQPDRLTVAACGDGGLLMAASELETVVRLKLPMVVLVYNDSAYGAEVHHFGRDAADEGFVSFPDVDFAAIARGHGFTGATVRSESDLQAVEKWLHGERTTPLLVDLKVSNKQPSWWLADAFKAEA